MCLRCRDKDWESPLFKIFLVIVLWLIPCPQLTSGCVCVFTWVCACFFHQNVMHTFCHWIFVFFFFPSQEMWPNSTATARTGSQTVSNLHVQKWNFTLLLYRLTLRLLSYHWKWMGTLCFHCSIGLGVNPGLTCTWGYGGQEPVSDVKGRIKGTHKASCHFIGWCIKTNKHEGTLFLSNISPCALCA